MTIRCYLDTNIFYHAYCPTEANEDVDWLLEQLNPSFQGITSEWTIAEMFRAMKKQVNLDIIEETDAQLVIDFFLTELGEMIANQQLQVMPVTMEVIMMARKFIFSMNLYAADAVHLATAIKNETRCFITLDGDFPVRSDILLLNPMNGSFRSQFVQLMNK